ncbi:MAG: FtsQ-type POTRA domain-containing protein [Methylovirgula sp.]|jgi:cell division protein FtsQ
MREVFTALEPSFPAYVGPKNDIALRRSRPFVRSSLRDRAPLLTFLLALATARSTGLILSLAFLAAVGIYGCMLNGQYQAFTAANGTLPDLVARSLGFRIKTVTILGAHELSQQELLETGGIRRTNSLLFLDVVSLRNKLKVLPFVKEASVTKLYPDHLVIDIQERQPIALWQKDGQVKVIAADGTAIDDLRGPRYLSLPRTVGDGANAHVGDYLALLDAAGDLRNRVEAGIFVAQRRWTLKFKNGIEVALPESEPAKAVARLVTFERDFHVLEKDIVALDLRIQGRMIVTLPDDVARARMDLLARPQGQKAGQT